MDYFRFTAPDIALDIGSAYARAMRLDNHQMVEEPSVVALDYKKMQMMAVGEEAKAFLGKSPDNLIAICPLQHGVIADYDLTRAMVEHYLRRLLPGISLVAPCIGVSYPSGATDVDRKALEDACLQAGARRVILVEESLACAYGTKRIHHATKGALMVNLGAGTSEIAVVNSYGVIVAETMKRGGKDLDQDILHFIREKYSLMIGESTAEKLKTTIGTLREDRQNDAMEVSGRDLVTGMPKNIDVYASDVTQAILPFIRILLDRIHFTLEKTPPELAADVMEHGIMLSGGGAQLDGLCDYVMQEMHVPSMLSPHPEKDVLFGCRFVMDNKEETMGKGARHDSHR